MRTWIVVDVTIYTWQYFQRQFSLVAVDVKTQMNNHISQTPRDVVSHPCPDTRCLSLLVHELWTMSRHAAFCLIFFLNLQPQCNQSYELRRKQHFICTSMSCILYPTIIATSLICLIWSVELIISNESILMSRLRPVWTEGQRYITYNYTWEITVGYNHS